VLISSRQVCGHRSSQVCSVDRLLGDRALGQGSR
jgi:hypothetical protein